MDKKDEFEKEEKKSENFSKTLLFIVFAIIAVIDVFISLFDFLLAINQAEITLLIAFRVLIKLFITIVIYSVVAHYLLKLSEKDDEDDDEAT